MSMPSYNSVVFLPAEANFIQSTMFSISQNQPLSNETDSGSQVGISSTEKELALSILGKTRQQIKDPKHSPISFTEAEAKMAQAMYFLYLETHGKPQGDLDWAYYIRLKDTSVQLVVNILRKFGAIVPNYPPDTAPQMYNPFKYI